MLKLWIEILFVWLLWCLLVILGRCVIDFVILVFGNLLIFFVDNVLIIEVLFILIVWVCCKLLWILLIWIILRFVLLIVLVFVFWVNVGVLLNVILFEISVVLIRLGLNCFIKWVFYMVIVVVFLLFLW